MNETTLYKKVITVTSRYLGPAADRFISRQIASHLNKKPENLKQDDISELINWIKPAMGILTEDTKIINKYIEELVELAEVSSKDILQ